MTINTELQKFTDRKKLEQQLAQRITQLLAIAIAKRGRATLAVSGGTTPIGLFEQLAQATIEWGKVTITLVDERWVENDSPDSNEKLVRDHLLQHRAATATFIGMKTKEKSAFAGAAACAARLSTLSWPLDVILLGMGEDGHTASLFPDTQGLEEGLSAQSSHLCLPMAPPIAGSGRMTLTLSALLNSRHLFLQLMGENKMATLQRANAGTEVKEMPIRAILQQKKVNISIYYAP